MEIQFGLLDSLMSGEFHGVLEFYRLNTGEFLIGTLQHAITPSLVRITGCTFGVFPSTGLIFPIDCCME